MTKTTFALITSTLILIPVLTGCSRGTNETPAVPTERLTSAEAIQHGQQIYRQNCAVCHGMTGAGGARTAGFIVPPQNFQNPEWRSRVSPERVFDSITNGVPGTAMPAWKGLPEKDRWDLVAYVLSMNSPQ